MRAGDMMQRGLAGFAALMMLGACATAAGGPDPIVPPSTASMARPQFFVQWKADLPGLTRRPAVAPDSVLPDYPAAAVRDDISGVTTLETCVTAGGRLADTSIAQSSGSDLLDNATLAWARIATFLPAEINGEPIAVCGYRFDQEWRVAQ